jgi:hypothetical protein
MPFVYNLQSKMAAENFATSGSANTEVDQSYIKPGATRAFALLTLRVQGKGAGLSTLSGIAFRLKYYPTTASSGSAVTPNPVDIRAPAAVATAGMASGGVVVGTGTPVLVGGCGCSGSGPGGWVAPNPDAGIVLDGGQNKSLDLFSSSGSPGLNFEFQEEFQE